MFKPLTFKSITVRYEAGAFATVKGRAVYSLEGDNGTSYVAYAPRGGLGWEVATLVKLAKGGRAWRWAKNLDSGIAAQVIEAARANGFRLKEEKRVASLARLQDACRVAVEKNNALACAAVVASVSNPDTAMPSRLAPYVQPTRVLKSENWRALGYSIHEALGGTVHNATRMAIMEGKPLTSDIDAVVKRANEVIAGTFSTHARGQCRAILDTLKAYGLLAA